MFSLKTTVAKNTQSDLEDQVLIKTAMTALGYYDDTETGLNPYADKKLFHSVKDFQKDNDLKVDGVIKPDGPTQKTIKERLKATPQSIGAFKDFSRNYIDLKKTNIKDADKYFHCKANYEATQRGWRGNEIAIGLSDDKERLDRLKADHTRKAEEADQKANRYGRKAAKSGKFKNAQEACAIFRPEALDEKY